MRGTVQLSKHVEVDLKAMMKQIDVMKDRVAIGDLFQPFELVDLVDHEQKNIGRSSLILQISSCVQQLRDKDDDSLGTLTDPDLKRLAASLRFWLSESKNHYNLLLGACIKLLEIKMKLQQPIYRRMREALLENKCAHCGVCGIEFKEDEKYYRTPCEHSFHLECFLQQMIQSPYVQVKCARVNCTQQFSNTQVVLCVKKSAPLCEVFHETQKTLTATSHELQTKGGYLKKSLLELLSTYQQFLRAVQLKEKVLKAKLEDEKEQKFSWATFWGVLAMAAAVCTVVLAFVAPPLSAVGAGVCAAIFAVLSASCMESDSDSNSLPTLQNLSSNADVELNQTKQLSNKVDQLNNAIEELVGWTDQIQPSLAAMKTLEDKLQLALQEAER